MFVVWDLDIGMNDWMVPRLAWDDVYRPDRGRVLDADALAADDGFALVDVISPCVSSDDHEASSKSYRHTRAHAREVAALDGGAAGAPAEDFVPLRREITAGSSGPGAVTAAPLHDGTVLRFRAVGGGYDAADRDAAMAHVRALQARGEIATGVPHADPRAAPAMHRLLGTVDGPLAEVPCERLCAGSAALDALMAEMR